MSEELTLSAKMIEVQKELRAPKGQTNSFGNYNYRSCEDIFEAVKPLLAERGLMLTVSDELVNIGERYYIKATAAVQDMDASVSCFGYAREALTKKGCDEAQITGAASSYARKYALNGLFLIDDTKDADTNEHKEAAENKYEDDKPWFNGFDSRTEEWNEDAKQMLLNWREVDMLNVDEILTKVKTTHKVSKAAQEAIKTLVK
jgi:hypothetical protein